MTPVFQTIFDNKRGNCLQAVMASLFDLPLDEVSHFIIQDDWIQSLKDFYLLKGYDYDGRMWANSSWQALKNKEYEKMNPSRWIDTSTVCFIEDYACAQVYSPKYYRGKNLNQGFHAVVVNRDLQIVHDPVREYDGVEYPLTKILGSNGVVGIDQIFKI